jgi:UDP-glucose 4-epimerase
MPVAPWCWIACVALSACAKNAIVRVPPGDGVGRGSHRPGHGPDRLSLRCGAEVPMHYLVTGGAGFIGGHLVEALLARGDRVTVLDDFSTGSAANLAAVAAHPQLTVVRGSVCDELLVDEVMAPVEAVIHLAAAVGVEYILNKPVRSILTNLRGSETVLQAACHHGRKPVFFASTSEVYGKGIAVPFREDDDIVMGCSSRHRWSYACAKLMDEFLALACHRERGLPVTIARFFNVAGPRQSAHYGMVIPRFVAAHLRGDEIPVHGDGQQSRCFLHVADCVAAVLALLNCPAANGQVVNIGSDQEISIAALAGLVGEVAGGAPARLRRIPYEQAYPQGGFEDMQRRVPDTTRLRRLTGWAPRYALRDIVADAIAIVRHQGAAP